MYEIALKKLAPILLIILIATCVWMHGYSKAHQDFLVYRAQVEQQSKDVQEQAEKRNADIAKQLTESARIIEKSYDDNQKLNTAAAADLRNRLRNSINSSNSMPDHNGNTEISDDASISFRSFLEERGESVITNAEEAERVNESLRSCQTYLKELQDKFNGE